VLKCTGAPAQTAHRPSIKLGPTVSMLWCFRRFVLSRTAQAAKQKGDPSVVSFIDSSKTFFPNRRPRVVWLHHQNRGFLTVWVFFLAGACQNLYLISLYTMRYPFACVPVCVPSMAAPDCWFPDGCVVLSRSCNVCGNSKNNNNNNHTYIHTQQLNKRQTNFFSLIIRTPDLTKLGKRH
jgi:hypothetical protein